MSNTDALRTALSALLDHYTDLVNSGDAGNWNPEEEAPVIAARAALAQPAASGEPVALWHLSGHGYAPVTKEQSRPPEPLTWDEAIKIGWRPFYAAPQPAPALVPPGWVLVPVEPTSEMLAVNVDPGEYVSIEAARILWRAMLAAAPDAQKGAA